MEGNDSVPLLGKTRFRRNILFETRQHISPSNVSLLFDVLSLQHSHIYGENEKNRTLNNFVYMCVVVAIERSTARMDQFRPRRIIFIITDLRSSVYYYPR